MSIEVGTVKLDTTIVLAPMSGVTDLPFRRLVKRWGVGLVVSEMIASKAMIYAAKKTMKMATHCAEEHPMSVQLAGCDPKVMAEAARLNEDRGAAMIDINMGCPAKTHFKNPTINNQLSTPDEYVYRPFDKCFCYGCNNTENKFRQNEAKLRPRGKIVVIVTYG